MFYETELTIPAGRTEANPIEGILKVTHGIIHHVEVEFRSGTDFTAWVKLNLREVTLFPTNPDGWFKADGRAIVFNDYRPVFSAPYEIKIVGCAPSSTYDHTVYVRIGILPQEALDPMTGLRGLFNKFFKLVGLTK